MSVVKELRNMVTNLYEVIHNKKCDMAVNEKLKYVNKNISNIYNFISKDKENLDEYIRKRDENNRKIFEDTQNIEKYLKDIMNSGYKDSFTIQPMSSFSSRTNLINDSDVDFGCLIFKLDKNKLEKIKKIFTDLGFKVNEKYIKDDLVHGYLELEKNITGDISKQVIKVSVKVRDPEYIQSVIKLHHKLDNDIDDKLRHIITYGKYLLYDKENKENKENRDIYNMFKCLVFDSLSFDIENASLFEY